MNFHRRVNLSLEILCLEIAGYFQSSTDDNHYTHTHTFEGNHGNHQWCITDSMFMNDVFNTCIWISLLIESVCTHNLQKILIILCYFQKFMNDNVETRGRRNIVATWPKCFHGVRAAKHQKLVPGIHALSGGRTTSHYTNTL